MLAKQARRNCLLGLFYLTAGLRIIIENFSLCECVKVLELPVLLMALAWQCGFNGKVV